MNPKDLVGSKKAPLGLVPAALEIGAAEAMENGAAKYGPFNWREQPIEFMSYLVAMKRHIAALIDGQDFAEDTGIHHLKHVAAGAGILLDAMGIPGDLIDNRPPKGPAADLLRAMDRSVSPAAAPARKGPPCGGDEACDGSCRIDRRLDEDVLGPFGGVVSEPWGTGDGPIFAGIDLGGELPPKTFMLPEQFIQPPAICPVCGVRDFDHLLDCPRWS